MVYFIYELSTLFLLYVNIEFHLRDFMSFPSSISILLLEFYKRSILFDLRTKFYFYLLHFIYKQALQLLGITFDLTLGI